MLVDKLRGGTIANITKRAFRKIGYGIVPLWQIPTETWFGLPRTKIQTVLDIGSLRGEFAIETLAPAFPNAKIHCFEPSPEAFPILNKNVHVSGLNIVAHNYGLGNAEADVPFYLNVDFHASSSFLVQTDANVEAFPQLRNTKELKAKIRRLDDVVDTLGPLPNMFIKIDTQGFEAEVIRGGKNVISSALACVIEIQVGSLYEQTAHFDDVYSLMKELGFIFCGAFEQLLGRNGEILYFDGIFVSKKYLENS